MLAICLIDNNKKNRYPHVQKKYTKVYFILSEFVEIGNGLSRQRNIIFDVILPLNPP